VLGYYARLVDGVEDPIVKRADINLQYVLMITSSNTACLGNINFEIDGSHVCGCSFAIHAHTQYNLINID
jgi:hypothetical protein